MSVRANQANQLKSSAFRIDKDLADDTEAVLSEEERANLRFLKAPTNLYRWTNKFSLWVASARHVMIWSMIKAQSDFRLGFFVLHIFK